MRLFPLIFTPGSKPPAAGLVRYPALSTERAIVYTEVLSSID